MESVHRGYAATVEQVTEIYFLGTSCATRSLFQEPWPPDGLNRLLSEDQILLHRQTLSGQTDETGSQVRYFLAPSGQGERAWHPSWRLRWRVRGLVGAGGLRVPRKTSLAPLELVCPTCDAGQYRLWATNVAQVLGFALRWPEAFFALSTHAIPRV